MFTENKHNQQSTEIYTREVALTFLLYLRKKTNKKLRHYYLVRVVQAFGCHWSRIEGKPHSIFKKCQFV